MPPSLPPEGRLIFVHSSDEHYGADRILLDIADALTPEELDRSEFWLPTDVEHGSHPLCRSLELRGATVQHLDLPVLRRAYRTPRAMARLAGRAARLLGILRREPPALVYCTTSAVLLVAPLARAAGARRVVGHVQEIWSPSDAKILAPFARACHQLLAISRPAREAVPSSLQDRTRVVLNATAQPTRHVPIEQHNGPIHFLVASRWNGWKGHRTLLEAWDRLEDPGRLTVLGGPPPSGDTVDVRGIVATMRHRGSVDVVGEVDDVMPYLERADVILVPSDEPEPFGLVAIEAFAHGRPVIASRGGGLADIVSDGLDGWFFTPNDPGDLARVLDGLTRSSVTAAGQAARATHADRFTAARYAAEWRDAALAVPPD